MFKVSQVVTLLFGLFLAAAILYFGMAYLGSDVAEPAMRVLSVAILVLVVGLVAYAVTRPRPRSPLLALSTLGLVVFGVALAADVLQENQWASAPAWLSSQWVINIGFAIFIVPVLLLARQARTKQEPQR